MLLNILSYNQRSMLLWNALDQPALTSECFNFDITIENWFVKNFWRALLVN